MKGKFLSGLWEFPGGKIEGVESPQGCIVREIKEKLGVFVYPKVFIKQVKHSYTHFSISMEAYHCHFISGSPKAIGCEKWRWIFPHDLGTLVFPASSHKLFNNIKSDLFV